MALVVIYGFVKQNDEVLGLALAAAPMVCLINSPALWVVLIIGLSQSSLTLHGLPQGVLLVYLLILGSVLLLLIVVAISILSLIMSFTLFSSSWFGNLYPWLT